MLSSTIDAWSVSESSDTESKETLSLRHKKVTSNAASHVEDGPTPARRTPIQWRHARNESEGSRADYNGWVISRRKNPPLPATTSAGSSAGTSDVVGCQQGAPSKGGRKRNREQQAKKRKQKKDRVVVFQRDYYESGTESAPPQTPPPPPPAAVTHRAHATPKIMEDYLAWNRAWAKSAQGVQDLEALGPKIRPIQETLLVEYRFSMMYASKEIENMKAMYSLMM